MYPKVKVRNQEEDDGQLSFYDQVAFDSVSLHDLDSSVWDDEDDSPPTVVRVPDSYSSDLTIEGEGKSKEKYVECCKQNIRASPIRPPRAVLSSPVNDGKIENGSRNKTKPDLLSGLKDHNLCQRHTRCKVVPEHGSREPWCHHMQGTREPLCYHHHSTREAPVTAARRVSKEGSAGKPSPDERKGPATAGPPRQRSKVRKERPEFVCI